MLFQWIGKNILRTVNLLGAVAIFFFSASLRIFRHKQLSRIVHQIYVIGAGSSIIVIVVALFTGMVLGLQLYYTLIKFGSEGMVGAAISLSLIRELGPVLTAVMVTARAGSAMTAEIGIQRITEQIDALYTMRIDPTAHLVSPRLTASVLSFPLLTAFFDLVGIVGGWATTVLLLGVNEGAYFYRIQSAVEMTDIRGGFLKSIVFAIIVSTVCCYQGYFAHRRTESHGAGSVGAATTSAVVLSCVLILISDYVVTSFLM